MGTGRQQGTLNNSLKPFPRRLPAAVITSPPGNWPWSVIDALVAEYRPAGELSADIIPSTFNSEGGIACALFLSDAPCIWNVFDNQSASPSVWSIGVGGFIRTREVNPLATTSLVLDNAPLEQERALVTCASIQHSCYFGVIPVDPDTIVALRVQAIANSGVVTGATAWLGGSAQHRPVLLKASDYALFLAQGDLTTYRWTIGSSVYTVVGLWEFVATTP